MQHLEILWLVSVERLTTPRYRPAPTPSKMSLRFILQHVVAFIFEHDTEPSRTLHAR